MPSRARWSLASLLVIFVAACGGGNSSPPSPGPKYPATVAGSEGTTHFGQRVADPYRWLEDSQSTPVIDWVRAQNAFSAGYVEGQAIYPTVLARLTELATPRWEYEPLVTPPAGSVVGREGLRQVGQRIQGRFYYRWEERDREETDVDDWRPAGTFEPRRVARVDNRIYVSDGEGQEGRVLLDVGALAQQEPDDVIQMLDFTVSSDGKVAAYTLRRNYSDLRELHLIDLVTQGAAPRVLTTASHGFLLSGSALLYVDVLDAGPSLEGSYGRQVIMRLNVSDANAQPELLYQGDAFRAAGVTPIEVVSGQLYFRRYSSTTATDLLRLDLAGGSTQLVLDGAGSTYFSVKGTVPDTRRKLVLTSSGAAMNRLVSIDPLLSQGGEWQDVLPGRTTDVVSDVRVCGRHVYAVKWVDGENRLESYVLDGSEAPQDIPLPAPGALGTLACSGTSGDLVYDHSTLAQPSQEFHYDVESGTSVKVRTRKYERHDPANYEVKQLLVRAVDGVQVPITLVHRKGLALNGKAPALVNVYGGFRTPSSASFNAYVVPLLEAGGVYVVAHVRGGGERGNAWYDAGRLFNKRNTYSDLAEVARYLVAQGYTSASRLGVQGWSNGGTSSAAAVLLYPDLFAVALPRVGVHDLTRYTLFTSGFGWTRDYGDPTVQAEFANLMTFSPLHSVQARRYPAIYVLTGQNDQRVLPGHSYKLAAALQNVATGPGPYLMHSFASSGHGIEGERLRSEAHALTFFFTHTGTAPTPAP